MQKKLLPNLRRYLLTGVAVSAPVGVTVFVLYWIFVRLDAILGRIFASVLGTRIPGMGLMALFLLLIGVGWVAQQAVGTRLVSMTKRWLSRFPLTRTVYSAANGIIESLVVEKERFFRGCVLIEYPKPGTWALGFRTSNADPEMNELTAEDLVSIFVPTSPNPTSGVLVFVPRREVKTLSMSVEEGFKLVLSGGVVLPDRKEVTVI